MGGFGTMLVLIGVLLLLFCVVYNRMYVQSYTIFVLDFFLSLFVSTLTIGFPFVPLSDFFFFFFMEY